MNGIDLTEGWVGFDLDGTLAEADFHEPYVPTFIGRPIPSVVALARYVLSLDVTVKVFTARVAPPIDMVEKREVLHAISDWTKEHIGVALTATATKDRGCLAIVDDISVCPGGERYALEQGLRKYGKAQIRALVDQGLVRLNAQRGVK